MDVKVSISLFSADYLHIADEIQKINKSSADMLHIDVMDGSFVELYGLNQIWIQQIHEICKKPMDIHFMTPVDKRKMDSFDFDYISTYLFHMESMKDSGLKEALHYTKRLEKLTGIVLSPQTEAVRILPYLPLVNEILVMTSQPGSMQSYFLPEMIKKIELVKELIGEREITLSVDGGLSWQSMNDCKNAGANKIIIGRSFYHAPTIIDQFNKEKT